MAIVIRYVAEKRPFALPCHSFAQRLPRERKLDHPCQVKGSMSSSSPPNPLEASILAVLGDLAGLRTLLTSESAGSASSNSSAQGQVDKAMLVANTSVCCVASIIESCRMVPLVPVYTHLYANRQAAVLLSFASPTLLCRSALVFRSFLFSNATIESFRRAERASDKSPGVLDTESIAYISGIRQHGFSHPALLLQSRMQKVLEAREISQEKAAAFAVRRILVVLRLTPHSWQ